MQRLFEAFSDVMNTNYQTIINDTRRMHDNGFEK
jgi:hypothetical protein